MQKYEVKANVLGLAPGDTFSSDDPYYGPFWEGGYIVKVEDEEPEALLGVVRPPEEPVVDPETPAAPAPAPKATRKRAAAKKTPEKP